MESPILSVKNLKVRLNRHLILNGINFEVFSNQTLAIIGPNGAGKTVLFRALLGFIPYEGQIEWQKGIKIGYVPQKLYISPDLPLTTLEFLSFKEKNLKKIEETLLTVGFSSDKPHFGHLQHHVLDQKIGLLSGGEAQKIMIVWALLGDPQVLLFDEPTSGIDVSTEETIYSLLHRLQEKTKITVMLISHELQIVNRYADNVICLNKKMFCCGSPQKALEKENLEKIFGQEMGIYQHHSHSEV